MRTDFRIEHIASLLRFLEFYRLPASIPLESLDLCRLRLKRKFGSGVAIQIKRIENYYLFAFARRAGFAHHVTDA